jgi:hypothetical protein
VGGSVAVRRDAPQGPCGTPMRRAYADHAHVRRSGRRSLHGPRPCQ